MTKSSIYLAGLLVLIPVLCLTFACDLAKGRKEVKTSDVLATEAENSGKEVTE